jgi:hypothetical protein
VDLAGTLEVQVGDDFANRREIFYYSISNSTGSTPLTVTGSGAQKLGGALVHVHGRRQTDGSVSVSASAFVVDRPAPRRSVAGRFGVQAGLVAATATVTHSVAVIVAKYSDQSGWAAGLSDATLAFSTGTASVKNYFSQTSRGAFAVAPFVVPKQLSLGIKQCPWDFSTSMSAALAAAKNADYDVSGYQHVVLWTPQPCSVGWAGIAYIGNPPYVQMVVNYADAGYPEPDTSALVASHELDHNLGLAHANGLNCTDGAGTQVPLGTQANCTPVGYNDWYSTMGGAGNSDDPLLDSERLRTLGWLSGSESQTVTSAGTYSLLPVYSASAGLRELRIMRPTPVTSGSLTGAWTVEMRPTLAGSAFDQMTGWFSDAATGVLIRYSETATSGIYAQSYLVDNTPGSGTPDFSDAPFQAGSTFTDPVGGITVHVNSAGSSGASVTVADTMAPTAPSVLRAVPASGGYNLSWLAATDNLGLARYRIYRDGTQIAEISSSLLTYHDSTSGSHMYSVSAVDTGGNEGPMDSTSSTYVPITPIRIVDSRIRLGVGASLANRSPVSFPVTKAANANSLIPAGAVAVTANLTAVNEGSAGFFSISPVNPGSSPATSIINFPAGDTRANALTATVGTDGRIWVVFVGRSGYKADVIFDITGYFVPNTSGSTYLKRTPNRILDTRPASKIGTSPRLLSGSPVSFPVTGQSTDPAKNVPSNAVAVVGNLTAVNEGSGGFFSLTPDMPTAKPTTSTINFLKGDVRANDLVAPLGNGGVLWVTFYGGTGVYADALFDVTGYFVTGTSGATYVPLTPYRAVDSRAGAQQIGLTSSLVSGTAAHFAVAKPGADPTVNVPSGAVAITANLTAVNESERGYYSLTPESPVLPLATSTINFPAWDIRANAITTPLGSDGGMWAYYGSGAVAHGDILLDVMGYYTTA